MYVGILYYINVKESKPTDYIQSLKETIRGLKGDVAAKDIKGTQTTEASTPLSAHPMPLSMWEALPTVDEEMLLGADSRAFSGDTSCRKQWRALDPLDRPKS